MLNGKPVCGCCCSDAGIGAIIDEMATASDAATPTNNAPNFIAAGTSKQQLVSAGLPYLRFKAKSGTGYVRVFRS